MLCVKGRTPLRGSVAIGGAKNSAVALIPATLLAQEPVVIENVPAIEDVKTYCELLQQLGATVQVDGDELTLDTSTVDNIPIGNEKVQSMRASYYLMGALLGRFNEVTIGFPGGCHLGPRPIDQHIKGFEALGANVQRKEGEIRIEANQLRGARIFLDVVSVGATINIMLAAVCATGQTVIENAAKEPEIIDVATLLCSMGAKIKGAGTDVIRIVGASKLRGCRHSIIPDRIEAGTYMIAAAATGGEVVVEHVIPKHLEPLTAKLREMGVTVEESLEEIFVKGSDRLQAVDVKTLPYPGFPTDLQQPFTALLTQADGTSLVTDNIYSGRFKYIDELQRMGAHVRTQGRVAVVQGRSSLSGTQVRASDLRAGAALLVAGLIAEGVTKVGETHHIRRGYEQIERKLVQLGAEVWSE
nr:UDP-N-acetylglucosamine 1-carboxyvinyltransferase [Mechercharimyces sp. CAU 1602]